MYIFELFISLIEIVLPGIDRRAPLGSGAWTNRHCYGSFYVIYSPSVAEEQTLTTGISHVRIFESETQDDVDL